MKKIVWVFIGVLAITGCLYGAWFVYQQQNSIIVVFPDAKGLRSGAPVRMSGMDIGKVRDLTIATDGVDVRLLIYHSARKLLTTTSLFVIEESQDESHQSQVLVKDGITEGMPLGIHARMRGMDSVTLWQLSDFSKQVHQIFDEPPVRDFVEKLQKAKVDMNRAINNIDREAILNEISQTIGRLSEKCDRAMQEVDGKGSLAEISHSIDEIRGALSRVANSKEAKQLRQALDELGGKVRDELARRGKPEKL